MSKVKRSVLLIQQELGEHDFSAVVIESRSMISESVVMLVCRGSVSYIVTVSESGTIFGNVKGNNMAFTLAIAFNVRRFMEKFIELSSSYEEQLRKEHKLLRAMKSDRVQLTCVIISFILLTLMFSCSSIK